MVNYTCYRCGYSNINKSNIVRHIARKKTCISEFNNVNLDDCKQYILKGLTFDEYKIKIYNTEHKSEIKSKIKSNLSQKSAIIADKTYKCEFCNKIYVHNQSLFKHSKTCKEKKKEDEVKDSMVELVKLLNKQLNDQNVNFQKELTKRDEQLKKQNKQIDELIKKAGINISTTNVMNNIKLLSYSETDRSHLTDKDIIKCLKHSNFCIPHLIEKIHFDKNKPQNHNVYISNLKNKYIMIYDGNKWVCKDRDEQLMNLIDDNEGIFEYKIEEWIQDGNKFPKMMKKFNTYVGIKDNNMVINKIKDEIKLLLYNNRNIVNKDLFLENKS